MPTKKSTFYVEVFIKYSKVDEVTGRIVYKHKTHKISLPKKVDNMIIEKLDKTIDGWWAEDHTVNIYCRN
jgi:hypothetical protein